MRETKGRTAAYATVAAALALIVMNVGTIPAQSQSLRVEVPFEFHLGERVFPAGTYIVQKKGETISVSDANGHTTAVLTNAIQNSEGEAADQLVFNRYANKYFLSEVRWKEYHAARSLVRSSAEVELARTISAQPGLTTVGSR